MKNLKDIVDAKDALNRQANAYYKTIIAPRLSACENKAQYDELCHALLIEAADDDMQMRQLPGEIAIPLLWAGSHPKFSQ